MNMNLQLQFSGGGLDKDTHSSSIIKDKVGACKFSTFCAYKKIIVTAGGCLFLFL